MINDNCFSASTWMDNRPKSMRVAAAVSLLHSGLNAAPFATQLTLSFLSTYFYFKS